MKKFLKSLLLFIFFAAFMYLLLLFLWGNDHLPQKIRPNLNYRIGSYGNMFSRLKEVKNTKNVDILFLGSSHTYRGFDTRIFEQEGLKVFNLGSSSQTPIQTNLLLDRYLDGLNPKMIIYDVYPGTLVSDGVESSVDIIANDKNDFRSIIMALKINNIKTYNTLIYAFIRDIFNLNSSFKESKYNAKRNDTYIKGGYVEKKIKCFKYVEYRQTQWNLNKKQLNNFKNIVSKIKKRNIKLILIYAPITSNKYNSYKNNAQIDSIMNNYAEYYNFNEILNLNDSLYFFDSHHLNQNGVDIFNKKIIEILSLKNNPIFQ